MDLREWERLDPRGPSELIFMRRPASSRAAFLLGAFDPPTLAHLALATGVARLTGRDACFCLTKVLLGRAGDPCLPVPERLKLLDALGAEHGVGVAAANRGTYLDVARTARAADLDAVFVIGSDKLRQLADPRFYVDGEEGVSETFRDVKFLVVPRGSPVRRGDVAVVQPEDVFAGPELAGISASQVRHRVRERRDMGDLVPAVVEEVLRKIYYAS